MVRSNAPADKQGHDTNTGQPTAPVGAKPLPQRSCGSGNAATPATDSPSRGKAPPTKILWERQRRDASRMSWIASIASVAAGSRSHKCRSRHRHSLVGAATPRRKPPTTPVGAKPLPQRSCGSGNAATPAHPFTKPKPATPRPPGGSRPAPTCYGCGPIRGLAGRRAPPVPPNPEIRRCLCPPRHRLCARP